MRADLFLFKAGYAKSREAARKSINDGLVTIDGKTVNKPAYEIDVTVLHKIEFTESCSFVGRGGLKLDFALKSFDINPKDAICLDIGASTGGFTDCLLGKGAAKVYAVDSGHGQLSPHLMNNSKVINIEGCNARYLSDKEIVDICDIVVMDVSFISQTLIHPRIPALMKDDGCYISLIKPQFEAGRDAVGKGGLVKRADDRFRSALRVIESARSCGLYVQGIIKSPVSGGDGNLEYLAIFRKEEIPFIPDRNLFL